jgi:hypothetical protein
MYVAISCSVQLVFQLTTTHLTMCGARIHASCLELSNNITIDASGKRESYIAKGNLEGEIL